MRTHSRLPAAGLLLLFACADAGDPVAPDARAFAVAGDLVVNTLDDVEDADGCTAVHCSLREAIKAAAAGETITFDVTGTIQLAAFPLFIETSIAIEGPGAGLLTVAAAPTGFANIFFVLDGVDATVSGLRLTGGTSTFGGAVRNFGTLWLEAMEIEDNTARLGGAILSTGTLVVRNSLFRGNAADDDDGSGHFGGAIFSNGTLTVEGTRFENNSAVAARSAAGGGAIYNLGTMTVRDSRFFQNSAGGATFSLGGALLNDGENATARIERSAFVANHVTGAGSNARGGGVMSRNADLLMVDSEVADNQVTGASAFGGGMLVEGGTADIANTLIRYNAVSGVVGGEGGGLFTINAATTLRHGTVVGNETTAGGPFRKGALTSVGIDGSLRLLNSVVTGNTQGADVFDLNTLLGTPNDVRGNVIGTFPVQAGTPDASNLVLPVAIGDVDPALGVADGPPLGFVSTYVVEPGSILVDQGVADGCVARDLVGTSRPQGDACDAGAIEYADGSFVTGGGWFASPAGAWSASPTHAAKATLTFQAFPPRRVGGTPTGQLLFVLDEGGFRMKATALRTLLMSGSTAVVEGDALLDGDTPVTFVLTASTGLPDRVQLRVARGTTGSILYDSGLVPLGGGSVVVHTR